MKDTEKNIIGTDRDYANTATPPIRTDVKEN